MLCYYPHLANHITTIRNAKSEEHQVYNATATLTSATLRCKLQPLYKPIQEMCNAKSADPCSVSDDGLLVDPQVFLFGNGDQGKTSVTLASALRNSSSFL